MPISQRGVGGDHNPGTMTAYRPASSPRSDSRNFTVSACVRNHLLQEWAGTGTQEPEQSHIPNPKLLQS